MDIPIEYVAIIGIFIGVLIRTILPYLKKISAGEDIKFNFKYVATALVLVITAGITTLIIFPSFSIPEGTAFAVFIVALLSGWGANDVLNRIVTN
ncbi:unnamed protein product [marine sediment metagenome]|uniref:Uncharacterized protein n=1 Tax=marine sediment metagenome TaxID=412755 RepID=X0ZLM4_9ZZZZ